MFFVGMSDKTYPGSTEWLIEACREAGFTPKILRTSWTSSFQNRWPKPRVLR